jgi:tetraacyldisaccharide 4'-kinase
VRFPRHSWARTGALTLLLSPLALLFSALSGLRRLAYRHGWLSAVAVGVPVIIVGNITAGGSGKTPLVVWLVKRLRSQGYRPGVVSRGYGGAACGCVEVQPASAPAEVGDEPLLIRIKTDAPVVVGRDRVDAARTLLAAHPGVDMIVSDDGLQHYRLHRDIELAVIDAATGLGNGWPLPAGPLREPRSRLDSVDAVIQVVRAAAQPVSRARTGAPTTLPGMRIVWVRLRKEGRWSTCRRATGSLSPASAGRRGFSTCFRLKASISVRVPFPTIMLSSPRICLPTARC